MSESIKLQDLFLHIPNLIAPAHCQQLVESFNADQAIREHSEDPGGNMRYASFQCMTIASASASFVLAKTYTSRAVSLWKQHLINFCSFHDNQIDQNFCTFAHNFRLLRYQPGNFIHPHIDYELGVQGSCTLNLCDDYTGGEFCFFRGGPKIRLGLGDALVFPASIFWVHETLPIIQGNRYSINSFLCEYPWPALVESRQRLCQIDSIYRLQTPVRTGLSIGSYD